MKKFRLSQESFKQLEGLERNLSKLILGSIKISLVPFRIMSVKSPKHIEIVPIHFSYENFMDMADSIRRTAKHKDIPIRWSGAKRLKYLGRWTEDFRLSEDARTSRREYGKRSRLGEFKLL